MRRVALVAVLLGAVPLGAQELPVVRVEVTPEVG